MIRLPDTKLPEPTDAQLIAWQKELDALLKLKGYPVAVKKADSLFTSRNKATNPTFEAVRETLADMCSGNQRCCYCEDSAGFQVEHILPKSLFPDLAFVWENYLFACAACNGPKSNKYAYFEAGAIQPKEFERKQKEGSVPPPVGDSVLIDPRKEDPLAFMKLDIEQSFLFEESHPEGTREWERANYTIRILGLNNRLYLPPGRKRAFENFCLRLEKYMSKRDQGVTQAILDNHILGIKTHVYPTVWKEMQRFHDKHPVLKPLFEAAPEALNW